jgi:hypothetical protein
VSTNRNWNLRSATQSQRIVLWACPRVAWAGCRNLHFKRQPKRFCRTEDGAKPREARSPGGAQAEPLNVSKAMGGTAAPSISASLAGYPLVVRVGTVLSALVLYLAGGELRAKNVDRPLWKRSEELGFRWSSRSRQTSPRAARPRLAGCGTERRSVPAPSSASRTSVGDCPAPLSILARSAAGQIAAIDQKIAPGVVALDQTDVVDILLAPDQGFKVTREREKTTGAGLDWVTPGNITLRGPEIHVLASESAAACRHRLRKGCACRVRRTPGSGSAA